VIDGKVTAGERRVLLTQWVGSAWEHVSKQTDMSVRSFEESGISLAIDGSQDYLINITGLDGYKPGEDKGKRLDDRYPVLTEQNCANCEDEELEVEE